MPFYVTAPIRVRFAVAVIIVLNKSQVFVANPKKTQPIMDILLKNQQKLLEFLPKFHHDRTDDEQFNDEKSYLIKQVSIHFL